MYFRLASRIIDAVHHKITGCILYIAFAAYGSFGSQEEFDPVEWLESDQALVIEVTDVSNLFDKVGRLKFWNHELLTRFFEELDTDHCRELLAKRGLQFDCNSLNKFCSQVSELASGKIYFFLNAKTAGQDWIVAIQSQHHDAADVNRLLEELGVRFLTPKLKPGLETQFNDALAVHRLPFNAGNWFLHEGWIFIHPDEGRAKRMRDSILANARPKRSLSQNRKWLSSINLSGDDKSDLVFYIDPSISRPLLSVLNEKQFHEMGLHDLPGVILKVKFGDSQPNSGQDRETHLKSLISGRLHIRQALPRAGVWELLSGVREIKLVPSLEADVSSAWFAQIDPENAYQATRKLVDAIQGDGFFDATVAQIRRREADIGLVDEVIPGSTGFFGNVAYSKMPQEFLNKSENTSSENRGDFFVIVGIKDREIYRRIVEKLFNREGRMPVKEVTEDSVSYWYETEDQINKRIRNQFESMRKNINMSYEEFRNAWMNFGYVLTDNYLFHGLKERSTILQQQPVPLQECHPDIAESMQILGENFGKNAEPFLVYCVWKSESQIWINSWLRNRERQRRTTADGFDMRDYKPTVVPLKELETIDEIAENLAVRIAFALNSEVEFAFGQICDRDTHLLAEGGLFSRQADDR